MHKKISFAKFAVGLNSRNGYYRDAIEQEKKHFVPACNMNQEDYLKQLARCNLCEHLCGVNRLEGQTGICRMTGPAVASATLHPAPPESYTVFMAGCNYKCLNCQNWTIAQLPDNGYQPKLLVSAKELARNCVAQLDSPAARLMGADRIFFSGGEPTIHLPYIEQVVTEARKLSPDLKVNFDTNGYLTSTSLLKVLKFTNSITYDIKDYDVVTWLTDIGLDHGQLHLLDYLISDTEDERRIWEVICANPAPRKLALALFLKTLLPIEALVSLRVERSEIIKNHWKEAYRWLSDKIQEGLVSFAHSTMAYSDKPFQQRLENVTLKLIAEAWL